MRKLLLGLTVILAGLSSCDLNTTKIEPTPPEISYYSEYHYSQFLFNDLVSQAIYLATLRVDNPSGTSDPEGVLISDVTDNMMTIEYKETMGVNTRLGKFEISFTGTPLAEGSSMIIHPDGLTFGGIKVSGDVHISVLPKGSDKGKLQVSIISGLLTDANNSTVSYACNLTRVQGEGASNLTDTDDTFTFTGSANGTFADKTSYNMTIVDPLVLPYGSSYFKSGKLSINPLMYTEPFYITFGTSNYINQVLLTYKGQSNLYAI
jgi:hypothetical protein